MKKPYWILIGITMMFMCVLLGLYFGRNSKHNYIPVNNISSPTAEKPTEEIQINNGKININTASSVVLETLPGIGPVLADRIIAYRNENGLFSSIEELSKVEGIGSKTLLEILNLITVED